MDSKTHFWKLTFLDKVILHMPVKFEQAQMKKEWVICKKRPILQKTFEDNFLPQNPFLKFYHFLWDQSAHSCKIWTGLVKKLMRSFIVLGTKLAKFRFNLFLGELWSFFWFSNFWAFFIKFSGFLWFCLRRNFLLCSIPDISDFRWVKSHEKWASYGCFSVFPIFEHSRSNF